MNRRLLVPLLGLVLIAAAWPDGNRPVIQTESGDPYYAGQLIVTLAPALRGAVALQQDGELTLFGVPALDEICRRWRVDDITALWRNPVVSPEAARLGCDLQYIIQFPADQDIAPVAEALRARPEVADVCPNAALALDDVPDDPRYQGQWHFPPLRAPAAWAIAKGSNTVINMVLDDGLDWGHPDIEANLWVCPLEDRNGNGRFDPEPYPDGDLDGIDQSGSGYIDDVIGFDFVFGDPDPAPGGTDTHGTHCWGIINAVTNNAVGVAGATWNTRSVAVRCGGGGYVNLGAAIAAIYWGVNHPSLNVWAISMSFGGNSPYAPMRDACQYAWDMGRVLYGSAGNDGGELVRYPACYDGVENVAASSSGDMKASWSNYGTWVDVTAPGDGILSTVSRATGSEYQTMSGTSMSAPLAAGVACWMKSLDPGMSNHACTAAMHAASDSMPDPLYAQGKLGSGRVSMGNVVLPRYYCNLTMTDWRWNDAGGNGNGRPDPGETAALIITYANSAGWQNAADVTATLSTSVSGIEIIKGTARFPDIPAGGSGHCSADSFVVRVPANVPPQMVKFHLTVSSEPNPAWPDTHFVVQSGDPRVLLVDDDLGRDYEKWYQAACDTNGILYDHWDVQARGAAPGFGDLRQYPVVVWWTGLDSLTTLTAADQAALGQYLNDGKRLILSGQNIAKQLSGESFLRDRLRSEFVTGSTGKPFLPGLATCPIVRGDTMVVGGGGGANNGQSLDGVRAVNGGQGSAYYQDYGDTTVHSMVRYQETDGQAVVFLPVPFEAINHSTARYLQKWTLLRRIFEWFGEAVPGVADESGELPLLPDKRPYALRVTPSPVTGRAWVEFTAPVSGRVELRAYNLNGRLVQTGGAEVSFGERSRVEFDATGLAAGTYLLQLHTAAGAYAQRATVVR
ncbi:MAG: S8 family serine peptidase [bacterium]